jgi:hypothetical protein
MYRTIAASAIAMTFYALPLTAQLDQTDVLFDALGLPEIIDVMRQEGIVYGDTLAADMLPGGGTPRWTQAVSEIYDTTRLEADVRASFVQALDGTDIDAMLDFYTSDLGETIVGLEISARQALLDPEVEDASKEFAMLQRVDETPRFLLSQSFVDANDLIEANVVGSLNSSYAFYLGLIDGGVMPAGVTPDTALQDIWAQEPETRENTTLWVYSFVMLAYQPLTDAQLQELIAFSTTDAGKDLTRALFGAFDGLFDDVSRRLGLGVAQFMATQEL